MVKGNRANQIKSDSTSHNDPLDYDYGKIRRRIENELRRIASTDTVLLLNIASILKVNLH